MKKEILKKEDGWKERDGERKKERSSTDVRLRRCRSADARV